MSWLQRFWFYWWDMVLSYAWGSVVRSRGTKILFVPAAPHDAESPLRGCASARSVHENERIWYVRAGNKLGSVYRIRLCDRGVTWVYGWEGEAADALRASHLLVRSAP